MKALLLFAMSLPLLADTYIFNAFEQASGLGAQASAQAGIDPLSNLPVATVWLSSSCDAFERCTYADGSASFTDVLDISTVSGVNGLIELGDSADATEIWGQTGFTVSLSEVGIGTHGMKQYEFSSGEQFTVTGSVSGGCSECDGAGWLRMLPYYVTDVPEPGSAVLVSVGLAVWFWRKRCES